MPKKIDEFTRVYVETALFAETDSDTGEFLDENFGPEDIAPETMDKMVQDCSDFQTKNWSDIESDLKRAGQDFWMTRNGHGVGFWDGDWPKKAADRLTRAADGYGEMSLYVGDDGLIYGE